MVGALGFLPECGWVGFADGDQCRVDDGTRGDSGDVVEVGNSSRLAELGPNRFRRQRGLGQLDVLGGDLKRRQVGFGLRLWGRRCGARGQLICVEAGS